MSVDLGVTVLIHFGQMRARQSPLLMFIGPMQPLNLKR
jgi:hypothetical protein